jgi:hypothetical protein
MGIFLGRKMQVLFICGQPNSRPRQRSKFLHFERSNHKVKKKLLLLLGGSLLSAFMLVGCNNDEPEPPPEEDNVNYDKPVDMNDDRDHDGNNRVNNIDRNDRGLINDDDDDVNNDVNRDNDLDNAKDQNTNREDIIEDTKDMRDRNNRDS